MSCVQLLRGEQRKNEATHILCGYADVCAVGRLSFNVSLLLLLPFARLLPKCCSNFRSELHVHAVSDPSVLKIWLFKWMSTTCHRQSEAPLATAFGSARC